MSGMAQPTLCSVCCKQDLAKALKPPMETSRALAVWRGSHIHDFHLQCSLCGFLFDVLNMKGSVSRDGDAQWKHEYIYLYASSKEEEPGSRVEVYVGNADAVSAITLIRSRPVLDRRNSVFLLPGASTESLNPISGRALEESVSWPLVRGWVNHCVNTHGHDTPSTLQDRGHRTREWASFFRLVDVRHMCIVEAPMSLPYAALSYVWGGSKPVLLCRQNMKELMTEGGLRKLDYLPQTFRDAIHVTEKLGIAYLWIDALCIQHDNDTDRNHQINGMDQIYRAASITIVSVTPNADCQMPGVNPNTRNITSLRCNVPGIDLMYARPSLTASIAHSDWESRGWTLQEKFFSKRLLYFTPEQVFFRCAHAIWAEDALLEPPDFQECSNPAVDLASAKSFPGHDLDSELHVPTVLETFFEYHDLLQQYVTRNLTRDTDILAAFSGMLNSFEHNLGPSAFGLPELVFDAALLWVGDPRAKRRLGFPSWSWCGWKLGQARKISWLVVSSNDDEDQVWAWSSRMVTPKSIEIHDVIVKNPLVYPQVLESINSGTQVGYRAMFSSAKFLIPLPQPLDSMASSKAGDIDRLPTLKGRSSLTAPRWKPSHILEFECDTFFDEAYVRGDVKIALDECIERVRDQGGPTPYNLDFLVMSGSRVNDTWFKRRQGTYVPPPAPGLYGQQPSASVNVMLVRTDEIGYSERIWVFTIVMEGQLPKTVRKVIFLA